MEIKGKVHCFFEQSGTFKQQFIKLGIPAEDYDIQNNFGETDHVIDLFSEIEKGYDGKPSIWDNISKDDLILAFFPCIYFCEKSQLATSWEYVNYRKLNAKQKTDKILEREKNREYFLSLALKMMTNAQMRGIRIIMENPWSEVGYLKNNFIFSPTMIDKNRQLRGDYYVKPTAFWFVNCKPTYGQSYMAPKERKDIAHSKSSPQAGLCSEERSLISPDYARNFICDFVIGQEQGNTQMSLFREEEMQP